jgi:hypothetical protein
MRSTRNFLILALLLILRVIISAQEIDTTKIDQALGRPGQKLGDVYKVGFPRTDLHVSVRGLAVKTGLALGSWAAFTGTNDHAMVMGDLVLLEDELNPVMEKLRSAALRFPRYTIILSRKRRTWSTCTTWVMVRRRSLQLH